MEDRADVARAQLCDEPRAVLSAGEQNVVHVGVVAAAGRNDGPADVAGFFARLEARVIPVPEFDAARSYRIGFLELGPEKRSDDFARKIRRADVDPRVLV